MLTTEAAALLEELAECSPTPTDALARELA